MLWLAASVYLDVLFLLGLLGTCWEPGGSDVVLLSSFYRL